VFEEIMSVVVFGSINLDLVAKVQHRPQPGETVLAQDFTSTPGGKGANQALAARRMGAAVTLLGAVGKDSFAEPALVLLRQAGVHLDHVGQIAESSTGLAFIHIDEQGENSITVVSGANYQVGAAALKNLEQILTKNDILVMQLEIPLEIVLRAIAIAHQKGAVILIDPAPGQSTIPTDLLKVDIITPNRGEAEMILKTRIDTREQATAAAQQFHQMGTRIGMVKLGAEGVVWTTAQGSNFQAAHKVQAIDSTGAGDAFAGALAALIDEERQQGKNIDTLDLTAAIQQASIFAALSTTRTGAQQSFPKRDEVEQSK
jgi:ribokinase